MTTTGKGSKLMSLLRMRTLFLLAVQVVFKREANNKRGTTSERLDSFGEMIPWICQTSSKDIRHRRRRRYTSLPTAYAERRIVIIVIVVVVVDSSFFYSMVFLLT